MAAVKQKLAVQLDINSPIFLVSLFGLPNEEKLQALKTLQKISQLTWHDVYQDQGS